VLGGQNRDAILEGLIAALPEAKVRAAPLAPQGILIDHAGDPARLPGYGTGFTVQEEGSQLIALAVGAKSGERILDACAGRGHKTAVLLEAVGATGEVFASDLHPKKLERLQRTVRAECTLPVTGTFATDLSVGVGSIPGDLDAVLVDAPCSGIGTVRRRPDLLLRRDGERLAELAQLQSLILANAATRVRVGGRLIYAVCSVLREESEDVVEGFLASPAGEGFKLAPFADAKIASLAAESAGGTEAFALRLLPTVHGTDGYFVASLVRVA
jgi:16S rRNA (cytosine967-C5)-methyltransferase